MRGFMKLYRYKITRWFTQLREDIYWFFISRKLDKLGRKYGGVKNIPKEQMPNLFAGCSDGVCDIVLINAFNALFKMRGLDFVGSQSAVIYGHVVRNDFENGDQVTEWLDLISDENPRRAAFEHMVRVGDLNMRWVEIMLTKGQRCQLQDWLNNEVDKLPELGT